MLVVDIPSGYIMLQVNDDYHGDDDDNNLGKDNYENNQVLYIYVNHMDQVELYQAPYELKTMDA